MGEVIIPYKPRDEFKGFHERKERWSAMVAHRRAGKTVAHINELLRGALQCEKSNPRFAYLAPLYKQAKDVAWQYLKDAIAPLREHGATANESELRVDLPNGGRVRLYGADNPDSLRGIYLDGAVLDEFADMNPTIWTEVLLPALTDRQGWAAFIGTPKGRNTFYDICENAKNDDNWYYGELKISDTKLISDEELDVLRKSMTQDQYDQEFECSFQAAITGSYYGQLMKQAEDDNRITKVPYDPVVSVQTAWDLGIGDATSIWFFQQVGMEIRCIDFYESSGQGLDHYVKILREKPYLYTDEQIFPHDAKAKELGTGKSREEVLNSLGVRCRILPAQSVDDGINAVRNILPRIWFDEEKCARGIEALRQYRKEWDDKLQVFKNRPLHDWCSHPCDAMRYLAMGIERKKKKQKLEINTKWVV
jgi:hypothetical protein